jgi:hypothetical protein
MKKNDTLIAHLTQRRDAALTAAAVEFELIGSDHHDHVVDVDRLLDAAEAADRRLAFVQRLTGKATA